MTGSAHTKVRTRCYRNGALEAEGFALDAVSGHVATGVVWIDLCDPSATELQVVVDELGLHELAVEDVTSSRQRPKYHRYAGHDFLTAYAVRLDRATGQMVTSEVAAFITSSALVTVRKDEEFPLEGLMKQWDDNPDLTRYGVGSLVHGLLDHLVDGHFDAVESLDEEIERLEDMLFDDRPHDSDVQRRSFELRKSIVHLRRVVLPMRELLNTLMHRDVGLVPPEMVPHFQDLYDHVVRATEWTESLRDLVATVVETNLTLQGNRLNTTSRRLASWAAIIAVPTAVTGFYGQNLPYPGFAQESGVLTSSAIIVALSGGLFVTFRRKRWL